MTDYKERNKKVDEIVKSILDAVQSDDMLNTTTYAGIIMGLINTVGYFSSDRQVGAMKYGLNASRVKRKEKGYDK